MLPAEHLRRAPGGPAGRSDRCRRPSCDEGARWVRPLRQLRVAQHPLGQARSSRSSCSRSSRGPTSRGTSTTSRAGSVTNGRRRRPQRCALRVCSCRCTRRTTSRATSSGGSTSPSCGVSTRPVSGVVAWCRSGRLPTPRELIPADVEDVVDTHLLLPGYAEWDFEGLFASRSLPTIRTRGSCVCSPRWSSIERARSPTSPPGPEVDLRAGPTNFPAERAPRLATAKQRIGAVNRRSGAPERRNSLPPGPTWFAGRDAELTQIAGDRATADRALGTARVVAIHGMPGVGKTALALRAAHSIADRFTRCLYVDLQAHSDGRQPLTVVDAVGGCCRRRTCRQRISRRSSSASLGGVTIRPVNMQRAGGCSSCWTTPRAVGRLSR